MKVLFVLCLLCSVLLSHVLCWGFDGHKTVANVAYRLLSKNARTKVDAMMEGYPIDTLAAINDDFGHAPNGKWSSSYHFLNVIGDHTKIDLKRDCTEPKFCIVAAIHNYTHHLTSIVNSDPNLTLPSSLCPPYPLTPGSDEIKPVPCPLANVIHFTGDVHQPLHAAGNNDFPIGGNSAAQKCQVEFKQGSTVLNRDNVAIHSVWDTTMITFYKQLRGHSSFLGVANDVYDMIRSNPAMVKKYGADMNPLNWAQESLDASKAHALNFDRVNKRVTQAYYDENMPIILQRLAAASIRLAVSMQTIFDQPSF